jgi:hypothetical protein
MSFLPPEVHTDSCSGCGDVASENVNGKPMCSACADEHDFKRDAAALDQIAALMSGQEWDSDTTSAISDIVKATGRVILDCNEDGYLNPDGTVSDSPVFGSPAPGYPNFGED